MTASANLSIQTPDVAAAIQLASVLAQAGCDVRIEPQTGQRYRVRGTANIPSCEIRSLMTAWIDREQICCTQLLLGDERHLLVPMLEARVALAG